MCLPPKSHRSVVHDCSYDAFRCFDTPSDLVFKFCSPKCSPPKFSTLFHLICVVNKVLYFSSPEAFRDKQKVPERRLRPELGAYDAPQSPTIGWYRDTSPSSRPPRRLRYLVRIFLSRCLRSRMLHVCPVL